MKPPERWPLHPPPAEAEALSSWLQRIASSYGLHSFELLNHDLAHPEIRDLELDLDPPPLLLKELAQRSGLSPDRLGAMTLAGWVPWLLDGLLPAADAYETYVHQFSVLLPPQQRKIYTPQKWLPWLTETRLRRACPDCLDSSPAMLLFWQLPIMASCTLHGRLLETHEGKIAGDVLWTTPGHDQRPVPEALSLMDGRTWQALTTGAVDLPARSVHAGIWFRLLRTLLDELTTTQKRYGQQLDQVRHVWDHCGHPFRAGLSGWRPFENHPPTAQQQLLEAAAATMEMIETGSLTALGTSAHLLRSEQEDKILAGNRAGTLRGSADDPTEPPPDALWNQFADSLNAAVEAAREEPAVAKQLYDSALYGCRDAESVRRLRKTFDGLLIPLATLSHHAES